MNWHTDWQRAELTFAIRSAALALLAFAVQWGLFNLALEAL